jgi:hypothetical protein
MDDIDSLQPGSLPVIASRIEAAVAATMNLLRYDTCGLCLWAISHNISLFVNYLLALMIMPVLPFSVEQKSSLSVSDRY